MIKSTVAGVLFDRTPMEAVSHKIYILRDGRTVLYVGKSESNAIDRVKQHCGEGSRPTTPDLVGHIILDNCERSGRWIVEFLTLEDCAERLGFEVTDVETAEECMIVKLKPCLNAIGNTDKHRIPKLYSSNRERLQVRTIRSTLGEKE